MAGTVSAALRCAVYARVSSELQDVENSIERQVRACRTWAERNGGRVLEAHVYVDEAISGALTVTRPALQRILAHLTAKAPVPFDVLLVDDDSRLDRGGKLAGLMEMFAARGVRVIAADGGVDLTDERQRLLVHVKAGMNEEYLRELGRRVQSGLANKVLRGFWAGGRVYGYRLIPEWPAGLAPEQRSRDNRVGTRVEVDPGQAAIVRRAFEWYAEGRGLRDITHGLNADGIPSPRGGTWDHTCIRAMLLNARYRGDWYWNRTRWRKKPEGLMSAEDRAKAAGGRAIRMRTPKPKDELVGEHREDLRLVDDATWTAVQARFAGRQNGSAVARPRANRHLVSGLMTCECGGRIVVLRSNAKYPHLTELGCPRVRNRGAAACKNFGVTRANAIEDALFSILRDELLSPAAIEYLVEATNRRVRERAECRLAPGQLAEARARVEDLEAQVARYTEAIGAGAGDLAPVLAALRDRQAKLEAARAELDALTAPAARGRKPALFSAAEVIARVERFWDELRQADTSRARVMLARLLGPVTVRMVDTLKGKAWRICLQARNLETLSPVFRGAYNVGSGGGI